MRLFSEYVDDFLASKKKLERQLGAILRESQSSWDAIQRKDPPAAFLEVVERYNWLGQPETKAKFGISQNLARNLPGAMLQDFLIHICIARLAPYPKLEIVTEVRVPFGSYPVWRAGEITYSSPSQVVDVAVGYRFLDGERIEPELPWPRPAISKLSPPGVRVLPLIALNSKIRVSQSEFFDWVGREELLTKGNPSCLSLQVALRAEMDLSIPELAQLSEQFYLLGKGSERAVVPNGEQVGELVEVIDRHLEERMT
jgi:hypothetical protein